MSSISERVAREHQRWDNFAGNGIDSPHESWTKCSCGAHIWDWQQYYAETDEDPDENWTKHVAAVTEALTREQVAAEIRAQRHESQRESLGRIESNGWWSLHGQIGAYDHAARIAAEDCEAAGAQLTLGRRDR